MSMYRLWRRSKQKHIMQVYRLTSKITTEIPVIDKQHTELFDKINKLIDAILQKSADREVEETLQFLDTYVMAHLGTEEEYMLRYRYPDYTTHKKQHAIFKKNLDKLYKDFSSGVSRSIVSLFIQQWIGDWFVNHIQKLDMLYVPYLKDKI